MLWARRDSSGVISPCNSARVDGAAEGRQEENEVSEDDKDMIEEEVEDGGGRPDSLAHW